MRADDRRYRLAELPCPDCHRKCALLPLSGKHARGRSALVHKQDVPALAGGSWHVHWNQSKKSGTRGVCESAAAQIGGRHVKMHRHLLPGYKIVDHKNGDRLDNRVGCNLRPDSSGKKNAANARRRSDNTSGYRGVRKGRTGWRASLAGVELGTFDTAEAAAEAYDQQARAKYGKWACVNFPRRGERGAR